jgi:hypothetical protein
MGFLDTNLMVPILPLLIVGLLVYLFVYNRLEGRTNPRAAHRATALGWAGGVVVGVWLFATLARWFVVCVVGYLAYEAVWLFATVIGIRIPNAPAYIIALLFAWQTYVSTQHWNRPGGHHVQRGQLPRRASHME